MNLLNYMLNLMRVAPDKHYQPAGLFTGIIFALNPTTAHGGSNIFYGVARLLNWLSCYVISTER
jgi:hypothetical protein